MDDAPAHDTTLPYQRVAVRPWEYVREGSTTKTGFCARCHGEVTVERREVTVSAGPSSGSESRNTILCRCGGGHLGHPGKEDGCGAYWFDRKAEQ